MRATSRASGTSGQRGRVRGLALSRVSLAAARLQRVVLRPQEAGVGAGVGRRRCARSGRGTVTAAGRSPGGRKYDTTEPMFGKSVAAALVHRHREVRRPGLPAEHVLHARLVVVARVRQRPDDRRTCRPVPASSGSFSQMSNAGHVRLDRLELAANVFRRVGLQVEGVVLRRPAPEEEVDARVGAASRLRLCERAAFARACSNVGSASAPAPSCPRRIIASRRWSMAEAPVRVRGELREPLLTPCVTPSGRLHGVRHSSD